MPLNGPCRGIMNRLSWRGQGTFARPAERVVPFYNQRGMAEQWIKEGQGRDQMNAAAMPFLRRQCRPPSASCAWLQPRQFHPNAGDTQGGGAVVTDQPAREADQDR